MDRWRGMAAVGVALCVGLGALPQIVAAADLLRCTGPDGRTIFTDDKSVCPEAEPYQPSGSVQAVDAKSPAPSEDAPAAQGAPREKAADAQAAEAQRWRDLKAQKQGELRQVTAEHATLRSYVTFCNDGHTVYARDASGVKERISCSQLHARLTELDARATALRHYLENELPEECRRAGCLPGWIR